jgi:ABC-type uncharacterized transport system permease subunit
MPLDRVTIFCFAASYGLALLLELLQMLAPRPVQRWLGLGFGAAGLLAHSLYLGFHPPALGSQFGSLLFLAWILAVFYLYGSIHHGRLAWGGFVLPLVLGLIGLSQVTPRSQSFAFDSFWGILHGVLLLFAAVGVCVGFVASLMYLVQAHRLRAKAVPGHGLRLPSLERLEAMNRRAIIMAFPLLTAGVVVGVALMIQRGDPFQDWSDPKIWSAAVLWVVFAILLYLRYGFHVRGRQVALLTILAFALLVLTLVSAHTVLNEQRPEPVWQGGLR